MSLINGAVKIRVDGEPGTLNRVCDLIVDSMEKNGHHAVDWSGIYIPRKPEESPRVYITFVKDAEPSN